MKKLTLILLTAMSLNTGFCSAYEPYARAWLDDASLGQPVATSIKYQAIILHSDLMRIERAINENTQALKELNKQKTKRNN